MKKWEWEKQIGKQASMKCIVRYNNTGKNKIRTLKEVSRYSHHRTAKCNSIITHKNIKKNWNSENESNSNNKINKRACEGSIDIKSREEERTCLWVKEELMMRKKNIASSFFPLAIEQFMFIAVAERLHSYKPRGNNPIK